MSVHSVGERECFRGILWQTTDLTVNIQVKVGIVETKSTQLTDA